MRVENRIDLMVKLGAYLESGPEEWALIKEKAWLDNPWFSPEFIDLAVQNIVKAFLKKDKLEEWVEAYNVKDVTALEKKIGIVMAGNIPLVGFHDMLCVFMSGYKSIIKLSSKDNILLPWMISLLKTWDAEAADYFEFAETLKDCSAYIATGSNNAGRYFEYYFGRYPSIIRNNKTSVALLDGNESRETLELLADDICLYYGLGCRNVTQLLVPDGYDFVLLLEALKKYEYFIDFHKYKHNYDYQLALLIMNNQFYMSNGSVLLAESDQLFAPVSRINYKTYSNETDIASMLDKKESIQQVCGGKYTPFGLAQTPALTDYADGVDTMRFLQSLQTSTVA